MIHFALNKDVYLVRGSVKHCLYDLSSGNLYHITDRVAQTITTLVNADTSPNLSEDEQAIVTQLQEEKLLVEQPEKAILANIYELRKPPKPHFAWIEVTRKCNLACTFCYEGSDPYCVERMSLDEFKYVADQLKENGIRQIQFIGGEPMILRDELRQMIDYCRDYFDFIEVYSNGVLITESWAQYFKANDIYVALSIHSYIPEEHDQLTTVKHSHKKVLRGLNLLKQYKVKYRIGTVRSSSCDIGKKPEDANYTLKPKAPKVVGRADMSDYSFEMFKQKAITKETKQYKLNRDAVVNALSGHQCFSKDLYVSSLLDVFPCVMERRLSHGNLKQKPLKDILNNDILTLNKDKIEGCKTCEFRYGCFDCRPDSNGRGLYQKPWYCSYNTQTGEWADLKQMYDYLKQKANKLESIPVVVQ